MKVIKIGLPIWLVEMLEKQRDKASQFENIFKENSSTKAIVLENHELIPYELIEISIKNNVWKPINISAKYDTGTYVFDPVNLEIKIL